MPRHFSRTLTVRRRGFRVQPTTFTVPRRQITQQRDGLVRFMRPQQIIRRRGFTVSPTRFQIRDIGAPGRGPRVIPALKKGRMTRAATSLGFLKRGQKITDLSDARVKRFAVALARRVGAKDALGMFQAQVVFRRRTGGPNLRKFTAGRDIIARKFGRQLKPREAIRARLRMGKRPGPG